MGLSARGLQSHSPTKQLSYQSFGEHDQRFQQTGVGTVGSQVHTHLFPFPPTPCLKSKHSGSCYNIEVKTTLKHTGQEVLPARAGWSEQAKETAPCRDFLTQARIKWFWSEPAQTFQIAPGSKEPTSQQCLEVAWLRSHAYTKASMLSSAQWKIPPLHSSENPSQTRHFEDCPRLELFLHLAISPHSAREQF